MSKQTKKVSEEVLSIKKQNITKQNKQTTNINGIFGLLYIPFPIMAHFGFQNLSIFHYFYYYFFSDLKKKISIEVIW